MNMPLQEAKPIFSEMSDWAMIREGCYKLWGDKSKLSSPAHMYDLEADPYELNNLVDDPNYEQTKQKLIHKLTQWYDDTVKLKHDSIF